MHVLFHPEPKKWKKFHLTEWASPSQTKQFDFWVLYIISFFSVVWYDTI